MINEIKNLSWGQFVGVLFGTLGAVSPGFLVLFLFQPELVRELDTIKVIIFSLSLSLPLFVVNMSFLYEFQKTRLDKDVEEFDIAAESLFLVFLSSYSALLISYLSEFTFKEFLASIIVTEAGALLIGWIMVKDNA